MMKDLAFCLGEAWIEGCLLAWMFSRSG